MTLVNNYSVFLNFMCLVCELSLLWCFILIILLFCFIYFSRLFLNKYPIIIMFLFCNFMYIYMVLHSFGLECNLFGGTLFISNTDLIVRNILIYLCIIVFIHISINFINNSSIVYNIEYFIFIHILIISSVFMLYCNDVISLFLFMEVQSMVVYILICMSYSINLISMGIRYYIVGTIVSLLFLFSFTFIYFYTGVFNFLDFIFIKLYLDNIYFDICVLFVYLLFFLKIYIFPFHIIGGDLYRWSPLNVLIFLSTILYCVYIYIFTKILFFYISNFYLLYIFILMTLLFNTFSILMQRDIRTFLGLGTSIHSSFLLLLLILYININLSMLLFYIMIYILCILCIFLIFNKFKYVDIIFITKYNNFVLQYSNMYYNILRLHLLKYYNIEYIYIWSGISKYYYHISIILSICLWSISGLPPFSGFFIKLCVLSICFVNNHFVIFLYLLLISIISSLYYIKIIKEFYYLPSIMTFYNKLTDIDYLIIIFIFYLNIFGVFISELFLYILF